MTLVTAREALEAADPREIPAPALSGTKGAMARLLPQGDNGSTLVDGYNHSVVRATAGAPFPTVIRSANLVHPEEDRGLSVGEVKVAASFPRQFAFACAWSRAWQQVANCVPPMLMAAVAGSVRRTIGR